MDLRQREIERKYYEILKKMEKEDIKLDISKDEDLSFAVMNLISIEEHLFMSGVKTNNSKYFDLLNEIREMRKTLMEMLIKNKNNIEEGSETWCILKHLLATTMRLNEVGTKLLKSENREKAIEIFHKAYTAYTLFWALNLGIFSIEKIKEEIKKDMEIDKMIEISKKIEKNKNKEENKIKESFTDKLKRGFKKLISCCIE